MSFLSRLLGTRFDPREKLRPLWFRVVEISRLPEYYARSGVADSVEGRFDMIVNVLALVMLRMESSSSLGPKASLLTELFVEDMDGQLRESGVGDVVVGKHMGKLMGALGGRLDAMRKSLGSGQTETGDTETGENGEIAPEEFAKVLERNVSWSNKPDPGDLAMRLRALQDDLVARSDDQILAGEIAR